MDQELPLTIDDFTAGLGTEIRQHHQVGVVTRKPDGTIDHGEVCPTRMIAAESRTIVIAAGIRTVDAVDATAQVPIHCA